MSANQKSYEHAEGEKVVIMSSENLTGSRIGRLCRSVSAAALVAGAAFAGSNAVGLAAEEEPAFGMEEIVVTATKRETNLQSTPIAVTAIGGEVIREARIQKMEDLGIRVPGLVFNKIQKTTSFFGIRGSYAGNDAPGADLPVGYFVDEIYISGPTESEPNFFDLERIEVLRGPQGTLFGRNVVGGAISVTTRKPSFDPEIATRVSFGRFNAIDIDAFATGAIVEGKVAGKLAVSTKDSDGYARSSVTGNKLGGDEIRSGRAQLLFTPNEDVEILLGFDGMIDESGGTPFKLVEYNFAPSLLAPISSDPDVVQTDLDGGYDRDIWGVLLRVDWNTSVGTVTSISSYRDNDSVGIVDVDASSLPTLHSTESDRNKQFSQELRLSGDTDDGRLAYTAGAYYLNMDRHRDEETVWNVDPNLVIALPFLGAGAPLDQIAHYTQAIKLKSYALFGEASYNLTEKARATVGARYTWDKKDGFSEVAGGPNPIVGPGPLSPDGPFPLSGSWEAFTPRVILDYQFTDDVFGYASISRGFMGGGFQLGGSDSADILSVPFNPEKAWNYEVGIRSEFFENRLRVNLTAFQLDTKDLQLRTLDSFGRPLIGNVGKSRAKGIELEVAARPVPNMDLGLNYGYTDAKYRGDFSKAETDLSGNTRERTPKHALTLSAGYSIDVSDSAVLRLRGDITHQSKMYLNENNDSPDNLRDLSKVDSLINASATLELNDGKFAIQVWGKNLTDERYVTHGYGWPAFTATLSELLSGAQGFRATLNAPRTYGLSLTYKYN